jgi:hypothetical protein
MLTGMQGFWVPAEVGESCSCCRRRKARIARIEYGHHDTIHLCSDCAESLASLLENMLADESET